MKMCAFVKTFSARRVSAVVGVAIAAGTVVFMRSLVATNDNQSLAVAEKLLASVRVGQDAKTASMTVDHRPGGRVMQGPPLTAFIATDAAVKGGGIVVTKALFAQRRLEVPPLGSDMKLVGRKGAYTLRLAGVLDWDRPLRGYPNAFVSPETARAIGEEWKPWEPKSAEELSPGFMSDNQRNFDRAKALLLWAAALTALCLLLNSLFLSIEARRREIAVLRMVGMTRAGVFRLVLAEAFGLSGAGFLLGVIVALAALGIYVGCDKAAFPSGMAVSVRSVVLTAVAVLPVTALAVAFSLRSALSVRPLEVASNMPPRRKHAGMLVSFACGFGAFVAVEVWGSSLMSAFVPSKEWPDAIVSVLPGGVSAFDIEKLDGKLAGVAQINELQPLQVNIDPLEELPSRGGRGRGGRAQYRNALLLASDRLPDFRFSSGERSAAEKAVREGDACIITEMMARARSLECGDELKLDAGRGLKIPLRIAGIVDLNWHMVTSRALVRGLNRMPVNTDGPVFVSFDTLMACDPRPAAMVKMTHLWLDYDKGFLEKHGVFKAGRIVEKEIVEALGLLGPDVGNNTVRLHSRDEIADGTLAHGVDIIGSMARIPFIFIAVVSLGFIAMLAASAGSRRREFAVLRAVGATRFQIAMRLAAEAVKISVYGILAGFPVGASAGWLFTSGTRAAMANWGLPASFAVPWSVVAMGAAGALFFALAVAVPTAFVIVAGKRPDPSNRSLRRVRK